MQILTRYSLKHWYITTTSHSLKFSLNEKSHIPGVPNQLGLLLPMDSQNLNDLDNCNCYILSPQTSNSLIPYYLSSPSPNSFLLLCCSSYICCPDILVCNGKVLESSIAWVLEHIQLSCHILSQYQLLQHNNFST
jgi:hypothetical protein